MSYLSHVRRLGAEGDDVLLAGGELDKLDVGVGELGDLMEVVPAPERDAPGVEGGQVGAQGRPLDIGLRPSVPGLDLHRLRGGIGVNADLLSTLVDHGELVAAVSLLEPRAEVALVLVGGGPGGLPLVRDVEILLKVGEQVHDERVLLVKLVVVGAFDSLQGVSVVAELKEETFFKSMFLSLYLTSRKM